MHPTRRIPLALFAMAIAAACETPETFAPVNEAGSSPAFSANAIPGSVFRGTPMFESFFDIWTAAPAWSRVLFVRTPVNAALFRGEVDPGLRLRTMVRFLTPGGNLVLELATRIDRVGVMASFTEYGKDGFTEYGKDGFTEYGKDGIRLVAPMPIGDAAWRLLEETKSPTLLVETRVDLLMEDEGIVSELGTTAARAVYDMTNASLIKSPRDAFSNIDPVAWVTERPNASGAIDHLVVIAFELWSPMREIVVSRAFDLEISGFFALDGQRYIEQQAAVGPLVGSTDEVLNTMGIDPARDPATGLPIVDVRRQLVVRSWLIPDADWKRIEAGLAIGTVTIGMNLSLRMHTAAGATPIDHVFLAGLAEPRPDPSWLIELRN